MEDTNNVWIEGVGMQSIKKAGLTGYLPKKAGEIKYDKDWPRYVVKMHIFAKGNKWYLQHNIQSSRVRLICAFVSDHYEQGFRVDDAVYVKGTSEYESWIKMMGNGDFDKLFELQEEQKDIQNTINDLKAKYEF